MDRRRFLLTSVAGVLVAPLARAQDLREGKPARVGLLALASRDTSEGREDFRQALRDRGWVEGQNIVVEERWAAGKVERLTNLAAELVRLKVEAIIAPNDPAALAARNATTTIPIVMIISNDPVRAGLVASLGRPGGNITGLSRIPDVTIIGKQLQLLATCVANLSRVAVLKHPTDPFAASALSEAERVAQLLQIRLQAADVSGPDELENAFAAMTRDRTGAVLAISGPLTRYRSRVVELAAKHRLPVLFQEPPLGRGRRSHLLRSGSSRFGPAGRDLCGQDPEGREAWRPTGRATHEVRVADQPQDGQGARPHDPTVAPAAGGSGDRVTKRLPQAASTTKGGDI